MEMSPHKEMDCGLARVFLWMLGISKLQLVDYYLCFVLIG